MMVYKRIVTKTIEVEEIVKPSDVYVDYAKEKVKELLNDPSLEIVDFRPFNPATDEAFISDFGTIVRGGTPNDRNFNGVRFIVRSKKKTPNSPPLWE